MKGASGRYGVQHTHELRIFRLKPRPASLRPLPAWIWQPVLGQLLARIPTEEHIHWEHPLKRSCPLNWNVAKRVPKAEEELNLNPSAKKDKSFPLLSSWKNLEFDESVNLTLTVLSSRRHWWKITLLDPEDLLFLPPRGSMFFMMIQVWEHLG